MRLRPFVTAGPLLLVAGCATVSAYQRADTLGAKQLAVGGDLTVQYIVDDDFAAPIVEPRVQLRYGLTEAVDVGGTLGFDGARAYGKFQLVDGPVLVSLAPGIRYLPLGEAQLVGLEQVLFVGMPLGAHQWVGTVKASEDFAVNNGFEMIVYTGASIGASIQASDHIRVHPELGFIVPIFTSNEGFGTLGFLPQGGIGLTYLP